MDEAVVRAMTRWPNVPDVYGWLSLDRRGQWRLQGGTIGNQGLRDFISRNYFAVGDGSYAFQNGPQRVFVELEYTPWVAALDGTGILRLHTGQIAPEISSAWLDEHGNLLLETASGVALLDDRDLDAFTDEMRDVAGDPLSGDAQAAAVEALLSSAAPVVSVVWSNQVIPLAPISSAEVTSRFGIVRAPATPLAGL